MNMQSNNHYARVPAAAPAAAPVAEATASAEDEESSIQVVATSAHECVSQPLIQSTSV